MNFTYATNTFKIHVVKSEGGGGGWGGKTLYLKYTVANKNQIEAFFNEIPIRVMLKG